MNVMSCSSRFSQFNNFSIKSVRKIILFSFLVIFSTYSSAQPTSLCAGTTQVLENPNPGGDWTSSDISIATVDNTGMVTGISSGTCDIYYTDVSSIVTNFPIIVDEMIPIIPVSGPPFVCLNGSIILSATSVGGSWSTSNPLVIDVDLEGVVTGVSEGTEVISYTITNGSCQSIDTIHITVLPLPIVADIFGQDPYTGDATICVNSSVSLLNSTPNGEWLSSDPLTAAVDVNGFVTGIAEGSVIISYTVTINTCTAFDSVMVHVAAPSSLHLTSALLSDSQTVCLTSSISPIIFGFSGSSSTIGVSEGSVSGGPLPSGVIGNFSGGVFTIDGTPTQSGTFIVTISTSGGICDFEATADIYIIIDSLPNMSYTYTMNGLQVDFTNTSSNTDLSYYWNFGPENSILESPSYTFPSFGNYTVTLASQNHCGTQTVSQIIGVNELENLNDSDFTIQPNPFESQLNIKLKSSETTEIRILDVSGKVLFSKEYFEDSIYLNVEELNAGSYFLWIKQESNNTIKKIMKQ